MPIRLMEADKLEPPPASGSQVTRQQVCDRLDDAMARLLLLQAPAGFGKTTAMLQFRARLQDQGVATAWLGLDNADNDLSRFLSNVEAALRRVGIAPQRPGSPHDLVKAIAAFDEAFVFFLDDFEALQEPVVVELVQEMLEHLPRQGRLAIGSRSVPALSLGRLRARGQVVEIGVDALRMNLDETRDFLRLRGYAHLAPATVATLHARTEGWGAALWLASMALHRSGDEAQFIARFSGSDRVVADYLAQDVLAHQPADTRRFLLHTSILRQLDPSLCQALCPQLDCGAMLQQLEMEGLFLMPVASMPGQWRYHSLFADFLRARLREESPEVLAGLHAAASRWYEAEQRPVPAIDHALEGQDWPRALGLLERHAESLLEQGRMRLLSRWFAAMPASLLRRHPYPQVLGFWATCFTRGPWEAAQQIAASSCVRSEDPRVQAHLAAMRPLLLAMQDRYQEAYVAGLASLQEVPASSSFARSVLFNAMANIFCVLGNAREAHRQLDGARASRGDGNFNRMYTESMEGILDLLAGRLRHAKARFRVAVDATHVVNFNHAHGNAWAGVLYACVAYEADQLDRAEHLLNVYLPMAREVGLPDHMILSHVMRARISFVAGDVDRALHALAELEDIGYTRKLLRVAVAARLERARLLLQQGSGPAAQEELQRAAMPDIWARERAQRLLAHDLDYLELAQLRWTLAFGDAASAVAPLTRELEMARLGGRNRRAVKIQLLRAMAQHAAGQLEAAMDNIAQVLRVCGQEGLVRTVLDEGPSAAALVRQFAQGRSNARTASTDPIMEDHLDRLLQAFGPAPAPLDDGSGSPAPESLTAKEIRVLELLAEGYSNSAMAGKLFVSDSTVRTHLRNLNLKLGASSRTHAVALARKRGLIG
ncbi:MAG: helix-turn-helix transcriptional regulator [Rhodoferax sp.]|nr:helix-turn-helix transcriptional regulator [Rhodoferax sp.]MCP5263286.1 helix-turn-helix transcriptional regulator [Rhodoferax sp.]